MIPRWAAKEKLEKTIFIQSAGITHHVGLSRSDCNTKSSNQFPKNPEGRISKNPKSLGLGFFEQNPKIQRNHGNVRLLFEEFLILLTRISTILITFVYFYWKK